VCYSGCIQINQLVLITTLKPKGTPSPVQLTDPAVRIPLRVSRKSIQRTADTLHPSSAQAISTTQLNYLKLTERKVHLKGWKQARATI